METCKECGYDHERPGGVLEAIRVLACAMPENDFITRKGKVPKTKEEELKSLAREV